MEKQMDDVLELTHQEIRSMMMGVLNDRKEDGLLDLRKFMIEYVYARDWAEWIPVGRRLGYAFRDVWRELYSTIASGKFPDE